MTDRTYPDSGRATGQTHIIRYALELGLLWIDGDGRDKVREALDALNTLEAQLEAIGAGDVEAAELATDLHIGAPVVAKEPRVLVVVSGGIADPIYDEGVDVEVFDWDNYNDEEDDAKTGVPAHFADLAEPINVPVEGE